MSATSGDLIAMCAEWYRLKEEATDAFQGLGKELEARAVRLQDRQNDLFDLIGRTEAATLAEFIAQAGVVAEFLEVMHSSSHGSVYDCMCTAAAHAVLRSAGRLAELAHETGGAP